MGICAPSSPALHGPVICRPVTPSIKSAAPLSAPGPFHKLRAPRSCLSLRKCVLGLFPLGYLLFWGCKLRLSCCQSLGPWSSLSAHSDVCSRFSCLLFPLFSSSLINTLIKIAFNCLYLMPPLHPSAAIPLDCLFSLLSVWFFFASSQALFYHLYLNVGHPFGSSHSLQPLILCREQSPIELITGNFKIRANFAANREARDRLTLNALASIHILKTDSCQTCIKYMGGLSGV